MQVMKQSTNQYFSLKKRGVAGKRESTRYMAGMVLVCFMIGIVVANIMDVGQTNNLGIWNTFFVEKFKYSTIQSVELFYYILEQRIPVFLILFLFAITRWGTIAGTLYMGWQGFAAGFLMATSVVAYGIKGIFLMIVALFPQYLIYIPLYIGYIYVCRYCKENHLKEGRGNKKEGRQEYVFVALLFMLMLAIYVAGIFLESYVNPYCLKKILKIF